MSQCLRHRDVQFPANLPQLGQADAPVHDGIAVRANRDTVDPADALERLVSEGLTSLINLLEGEGSGFGAEEIRLYLEHLERMAAQDEEALSTEPADDDVVIDTPEQRAASRARLARMKELLTASVLGTG